MGSVREELYDDTVALALGADRLALGVMKPEREGGCQTIAL